jgi:hypothetical protein
MIEAEMPYIMSIVDKRIDEKIDARLSRLEHPASREGEKASDQFAWVIEHSESEPSRPRYFDGCGWTDPSDHLSAIRYARQEDAERMNKMLDPPNLHRVREHGWIGPSRSAKDVPKTLAGKVGEKITIENKADEACATVAIAMREAVKKFGGADGVFNMAGFQSTFSKMFKMPVMINSQVARAVLCSRGDVEALKGECHFLFKGRVPPTPQERPAPAPAATTGEILPCRHCGKQPHNLSGHWLCDTKGCRQMGPANDADGRKWNLQQARSAAGEEATTTILADSCDELRHLCNGLEAERDDLRAELAQARKERDGLKQLIADHDFVVIGNALMKDGPTDEQKKQRMDAARESLRTQPARADVEATAQEIVRFTNNSGTPMHADRVRIVADIIRKHLPPIADGVTK